MLENWHKNLKFDNFVSFEKVKCAEKLYIVLINQKDVLYIHKNKYAVLFLIR